MLLLVTGLGALNHFRQAARLSEGVSLLNQGKAESAGRILADLADSWSHGAQARAGLRVAQILGASREAAPNNSLDPSPFPLAMLARRAFEHGQFQAASDLMDFARDVGEPIVPLVETAALIEQGRYQEIDERSTWPAGRLARHVDHYLETRPPDTRPSTGKNGLILRDRTGQPLGHFSPENEITLVSRVLEEWIPRAIREVANDHRDAVSLRLSLDLEISKLALEALGTYRGSVVILDPQNGQILAAVSDRKSLEAGGTPAFDQRREPASIAKLITATAALRAGIDPDAEISTMTCNGHRVYNGVRLYCPYIAGQLRGFNQALAISCNLAFADLGVQVGRQRMLKEHRRFGFDTPLGPFPGGQILAPQGDDRQLADLSIGLEATDITPLHAALLAAVMAGDGVMPTPSLVHAEDGQLGFHPRRLPSTPGRPVIDREWLPILISAMERVAERGTANRVAPPGFPVAMKTGTASDPRWGFHVNYIGIGPMPSPRLAFCVRVTHQRTSRQVRNAARRVTQRLLRELDQVAKRRGWSTDRE